MNISRLTRLFMGIGLITVFLGIAQLAFSQPRGYVPAEMTLPPFGALAEAALWARAREDNLSRKEKRTAAVFLLVGGAVLTIAGSVTRILVDASQE